MKCLLVILAIVLTWFSFTSAQTTTTSASTTAAPITSSAQTTTTSAAPTTAALTTTTSTTATSTTVGSTTVASTTAAHSLQCAADYGNGYACCGQPNETVTTQYQCPSYKPKCDNYVKNSNWGTCIVTPTTTAASTTTAAAATTTAPAPAPVTTSAPQSLAPSPSSGNPPPKKKKGSGKCLKGSWIDETGKCRICPAGRFCNANDMKQKPKPCPKGTYSDKLNITSKQDCTQCPAKTFGDEEGLEKKNLCKPCGFGSNSKPGAKICSVDVIVFIIIILCVGVLAACIIYPMMQKGLCNCLPCCFKDPKFSDNELKAASVVPVPAPPPKKKDFNLP